MTDSGYRPRPGRKTAAQRAREVQLEAKQEHDHGSRLLGRFFLEQLVKRKPSLEGEMRAGLKATFKRPKHRALHALPPNEGQTAPALRSVTLAEDIAKTEAQLETLKTELVTLQRTHAEQVRKETDIRLLHVGEVMRAWIKKNPGLRKVVQAELPARLRTERDFAAVDIAVPADHPLALERAEQSPAQVGSRVPTKVSEAPTPPSALKKGATGSKGARKPSPVATVPPVRAHAAPGQTRAASSKPASRPSAQTSSATSAPRAASAGSGQ